MPPSTSALESLESKLNRAREHIIYLNSQLNSIVRSYPPKWTVSFDADSDPVEYRVYVSGEAKIPERLSIIAGEAVHQIRSTLDHLIGQLVIKNGGTLKNTLEFPICNTREKFHKAVKGGKINGVSNDAALLIEEDQPFNQTIPKDQYLSVLHHLDIIDKHRNVLIFASTPNFSDVDSAITVGGSTTPITINFAYWPFKSVIITEEQKEVTRFTVHPHEPSFYANLDFPAEICFPNIGSNEFYPVIETLWFLLEQAVIGIARYAPCLI